ncbi:MAG: alpha/beta hydrolase [Bacteroidetes bacterium]|nr:alpha/beta hydrolase [Bacteroidota bacterium]
MRLQKYFILIACTLIFFSCKKETSSNISTPPAPVAAATYLDVSYGSDAAQKYDAYLPANRSTASTKVIILIHGGAWSSGDKTDFSTLQNGMTITDTIKTRFPNFAIFNINYRLSTGTSNLFPAQENDVKAALQYIYNKATDYLISDKYVLLGASAGGHLALLQGFKYTTPVKPKAIVSLFGPSDLTDMYNNPVGGNALLALGLAQVVGATPTSNAALYNSSSPVNYITSTSPPTILFHGSNDPLVSPSQSAAVKTKLSTVGVTAEYYLYTGKGHGDDWGDAIYKDCFDKTQAFITANVQ